MEKMPLDQKRPIWGVCLFACFYFDLDCMFNSDQSERFQRGWQAWDSPSLSPQGGRLGSLAPPGTGARFLAFLAASALVPLPPAPPSLPSLR